VAFNVADLPADSVDMAGRMLPTLAKALTGMPAPCRKPAGAERATYMVTGAVAELGGSPVPRAAPLAQSEYAAPPSPGFRESPDDDLDLDRVAGPVPCHRVGADHDSGMIAASSAHSTT
jgi:hypothetical protein